MNLLSSLEATTPARLMPPCAETVLALAERLRHSSRQPLEPLLAADPGAAALAFQLAATTDLDLTNDHEAGRQLLAAWLARPRLGFADWSAPEARITYQAALLTARAMRCLAESQAQAQDQWSWIGIFAWLGKLVHGQASDAVLERQEPLKLTRLLARRWSWPDWLREPLTRFDAQAAEEAGPVAALRIALGFVAERLPEATLGLTKDTPRLESFGDPMRLRRQLEAILRELPAPPVAVPAPAAELLMRSLQLQMLPTETSAASVLERLEEEWEAVHTRLRQLEAASTNALRDQRLESLAEFAAGAAHEINNPLAVISAQAQHLLKSEESLERAHALERIIGQSKRIHTLLRDLMLYARPPKAKPKVVKAEVLVDAALRQAKAQAVARDVRLSKASKFGSQRLRVDARLVGIALECLLKNAIAAAPEGGWAQVSLTEADADHVSLIVEDNGPGFEATNGQRFFDPFFSGKSAGRGSGLGLPKVWRIAQLHDGTIHADSQPGQPTRFVLTLPAATAPATGALRKRRPAPRTILPMRKRLRPAARRPR